ncbi:TAXI family TRAP transporter solute-binding subunit [Oceanospirillum beijerinckii]|uniref:TAXI family TRAP transporter solute-binding subunit n=1 Tax=Oceanospirillum beijerinckii TaxID=64976 RepID=UPI000403DBFA|nr:TAXI family TRAP transporter solute-binding subunit [Oceanospirillum beijerinckii]
MQRGSVFGVLLGLGVMLQSASTLADSRILALGTGGVTGLYYPSGGAICRLVNLTRQQHGIRCALRSTLGSVANLQKVATGELDLGIAEAGQLANAFYGQGDFTHASPQLRTLVGLFPEYISVLVRRDSGIQSFSDLKHKRFNIGKTGSSQRLTMDILMTARGWRLDDFALVEELEPAEQADALCDNRIDASLYVVGHPSGAIKEAIQDCDSRLINLEAEDIAALEQQSRHYQALTLPGSLYSDRQNDVLTAGVNATLFTRADLPDDVAYTVVKSLFEQFDSFRRLHPAFEVLDVKHMVQTPLAAPMHPGAQRYFQEQGFLP